MTLDIDSTWTTRGAAPATSDPQQYPNPVDAAAIPCITEWNAVILSGCNHSTSPKCMSCGISTFDTSFWDLFHRSKDDGGVVGSAMAGNVAWRTSGGG